MDTDKDRRKILQFISWWVPVAFLFWGPIACKSPKKKTSNSCQDLSDLKDSELTVRNQLGYVDQSPFEDRTCANCQLFVASEQAVDCGSCLAMKGPVMNQGYCTVWAPVMNN